jgi:hypothetical protein
MRTPVNLLKFAGKALLNAAGGGFAGDLVVDVLPDVVRDVWGWWAQDRDEGQRRAEVEALAQAPPEEVRQAVLQVIKEIAADQPRPVQKELGTYLLRVPLAIRKQLRRPDDPTGTTVPPDRRLQKPDDLVPLLTVQPGPRRQAPTEDEDDAVATCSEVAGAAAVIRAHADGATTSGWVTLTVMSGPHKGKVFTFAGHDTFLVGRSKRAHFQLPSKDKYFSRIHFMIEMNPPVCRVMDMGSHNGTYVNGRKVEDAADLHDGDRIKAGHTILRVTVQGERSVVAVRPSAPCPPPPPPALGAGLRTPPPPATATVDFVATVPVPAAGACLACRTRPGGDSRVCSVCREQAGQQPQPIAGYLILKELGRGGMGVVSLAVRQADDSVVALKTIIPRVAGTETQVQRFLREARILQQLDHPNIVAFRDMGESNGQLYFAMDFVLGTDAAVLLKENGPLPVAQAVRLVCQMLQALDYAHAKQFVHRDIKPANLLVAQEAGGEVARLADFGLARTYQASQMSGLTMTGDVGGTVAFMAPEQITNYREAKPSVDQYAAAGTLYNLLTASSPFNLPKHPQQRLLMILQEDPVPVRDRRPDLPPGLAEAIDRGLSREAADRFADVKALRQALLPFARL